MLESVTRVREMLRDGRIYMRPYALEVGGTYELV
jgi:hypothetical protein